MKLSDSTSSCPTLSTRARLGAALLASTVGALGLVGAISCGQDEQSGTVSVTYVLGAANSCATLGVTRVLVEIGDGLAEEEVDCDPTQPVVLDSVKAGNYDLKVSAKDAEGITVMDNEGGPTSDDSVEIVGGQSKEVNADLSATPATVRARWTVNVEGQAAQCEFVLPTNFEVVAYENGGTSTLLSHSFPCAQPPGYIAVPDPNRQINGQDLDAVSIIVRGANNTELTRATYEFAPPGAGRVVDFDLVCSQSGDTITCTITSPNADTGADATTGSGDSTGGTG